MMELNYRQNLGGYSSVRNIQINILVVDDDPISLNVITKHLQAMNYHVVATTNPIEALSILRREHETFDIVLSDVHMPQMSGLDLLSHVVEEYQLPIVLMSVDCNKNIMLKGLESGASFYIVKPITEESLKKLWQFAISGRKSTSIEKPSNIITSVSPNTNKYGQRTLKRSNEDTNHGFNGKITKKPKLIWTTSLHNLFLEAVNKIGIEKAVPKKILELMNVPGLRRENVASHLQKYRIFLKRISELSDPSENGFLYNSNERPLRSSFILNEITYLTNNLQQQYRELLKGSRKTHKNSSEDTNSNNPNSIRVNCIGNVQSTMNNNNNNNNYVGLRISNNGEMIMNNHHMGDQLRHVDVGFHFDTNKGTTFGNDFEFGSFDSPDYGVETFEGFDKGVFINDDISFERYYSEDVN